MARGRSTLLLLVACLALFGYIWFVERHREVSEDGEAKKPNVFASLDAETIDELVVTSSKGETTTLKKDGGAWKMTAPIAAGVDAAEVSGITSNLASITEQRVVDEAPKDLAAFGLATPRVKLAFHAAGATGQRTLMLGEKTATGGDLYAKTGDSPRVFLVSAFVDTTFDRGTFDLRDKTVVVFDREKVDRVELVRGADRVALTKAGAQWNMTAPVAVKADTGAVEALIGRLHSATMKSIAAEPATDLAPYGLDAPKAVVTFGAGSSTTSFLLGGPSDAGAVFAKDGARAMVFTVDATLADDLRKTADDFRPRDVFEFRAFTASRVELTRDGATTVFEKAKGTDAAAPEKWTQASPKKDVSADTIGDALSSLSNLRAESFTTAVPVGASPVFAVAATFAEGRKERVQVLKAGTEYVATRDGDAGAMKLSTAEVDAIMKTLDGLK